MKNVHLIPTDKPSRLGYLTKKGKEVFKDLRLFDRLMPNILDSENQNIYITSDYKFTSSQDWFIDIKDNRNHLHQIGYDLESVEWTDQYNPLYFKKVILTTDQDLIKNGVQAIDDTFLEWFVDNPSCEFVEVTEYLDSGFSYGYKIIIPKKKPNYNMKQEILDQTERLKEEPKQETFNSKRGLKEVQLKEPDTCEHYKEVGCVKDVCNCYTLISKQETVEEAADKESKHLSPFEDDELYKKGFIAGVEWKQEKSYSEEEVFKLICDFNYDLQINEVKDIKKWFEQFKKK